MTVLRLMEQWLEERQEVQVNFQSGKKEIGRLIAYDNGAIILEQGEKGNKYNPLVRIVCREWASVQNVPPYSGHD